MKWPWRQAMNSEEIDKRVAETEQAILQIKQERELEEALTPEIRERAKVLVRRGNSNRYTESLMLAWQSNRAAREGGEG